MAFATQQLPVIANPAVHLERSDRGLALVGEGMELMCDLTSMLSRIRQSKLAHELLEQDPVIAALLADGLSRAADNPQLSPIVARMRLTQGDSVQALRARATMDVAVPDVVYLDPMFPARQKSAAVKKKFQLLHHLESPCANEEELLHAAIAAKPRKVVIKRPAKGPYLAGIKPSYSIDGKAVRYDCIVPASMKL